MAPPTSPRSRIGFVLHVAAAQRRGWIAIGLATLLASLVALAHPWPLALLIDSVLVNDSHDVETIYAPFMIVALAAATVALFAIDSLLGYFISRWWITAGQAAVYDLARRVFAHAQRRSIVHHARADVGDQLSRITGDSWCVYNLAAAIFFTPIQSILMTIAVLAILYPINPTLTSIALLVAPVQAVGAVYFGRRSRLAHARERESEAKIESHVQQTLAGIPLVQGFAQEQRELARFSELTGSALRAQRRSVVVAGVASLFAGGVTALGSALILALAAREVLAGRMTLGQLQLFVAYLAILHGELVSLAGVHTAVQGARAGVDRVMDILEAPIEIADRPNAKPLDATNGLRIELRDVSFAYDPNRPVLRDVSLTIDPGEVLALVGTSGSGKSTLAALLQRLIDPGGGAIFINEADARDTKLDDLRRAIVGASQDAPVLAGSIRDNLLLARADASEDDIDVAVRVACADEFIADLDAGLDTLVGESGATLSGGQRQRLAIARAILARPAVLVLDEPTSALDAETESRLIENILDAREPTQTIVIIAHRLSTIRSAERIIVMSHGQVIEQGSHESLLRSQGPYARLWHLQQPTAEVTQ